MYFDDIRPCVCFEISSRMMNARNFVAVLSFLAGFAGPLRAQETPDAVERAVDSPSPDGRFAFLTIHQPGREPQRTCDLIETKSGKVLLRVAESDEGKDRLNARVLWTPDSRRFALCATYNHFGEVLSVYFRAGDTFKESRLPELSAPEIPERLKHGRREWKWTEINSQHAQRWRKDGALVVKIESLLQAINSSLFLTSGRDVVLRFDRPARGRILHSTQKVAARTEPD